MNKRERIFKKKIRKRFGLAVHHGAVAEGSTYEVDDEELGTRAVDEDEGQAVSDNGPE